MLRLRVLAGVLCVCAAGAQTSQIETHSEPFYKRFSFGVRGGGLVTGLMDSRTTTESTTSTDPPLSTITFNESAAKRYTVGPTVGFRLTDRMDLRLDILFKNVGYDSGVTVQTQLTDEEIEDGDVPEFISGHYERTRADQWDISFMGRYYNKDADADGPRLYIVGGPAISTISGIKSFSEDIKDDWLSDTNTIPVNPARSAVPGVTAGAGVQFRDDFNLKFEFEVRYTRWLQRTFDNALTRSNPNQVEALISFSF